MVIYVIEIKNAIKIFGKDFKAVDNLSLNIEEGFIYGFLGPNGAGKTTTLKMITGILRPDSGQILINGIDVDKNPLLAKEQFGFVSDNPDLFLKLKGIEYLQFVGTVYGVNSVKLKENIYKYSKMFEMSDVLNNKIESYSHGMRQKMAIIGALIHDPKVWILDEPLTGLDPKSSFTLKEMMREHASKGNVVLFSTHVLEVAEKVCDKVAVISKGKLIFNGTIDEMKGKVGEDDSLEKMFLELVENE
jgi:ABC-2 type transport system ATP-binding protein